MKKCQEDLCKFFKDFYVKNKFKKLISKINIPVWITGKKIATNRFLTCQIAKKLFKLYWFITNNEYKI